MSDHDHSSEVILTVRNKLLEVLCEARDAGVCPNCLANAVFSAAILPLAYLGEDMDAAGAFIANCANELLQGIPAARAQMQASKAKADGRLN